MGWWAVLPTTITTTTTTYNPPLPPPIIPPPTPAHSIDCKGCTQQEGCLGGNVCLPGCRSGYGYQKGACVKCGTAIPGCGRCRRCWSGPACHRDQGIECICCQPGMHFNSTGGPKKCVRDEDYSTPEPDPPDEYTPKIPAASTLIDPAVSVQQQPQQPQQPQIPVPPVVTPLPLSPAPLSPALPQTPGRDPNLDVCQPLTTPAVVAPTAADAAINGLTEPQMMQYGVGGVAGVDGCVLCLGV